MLYFFVLCLFLCVLFFFVSRLFPKLKPLEEKLMSNNKAPQIKYDVFVSFRGEDIRRGFLSHLTDTFQKKKIDVFVDENLEKGEKIWASLVEAIEGSSILLIIFSPDYASSRWCLEELVKILECKEKYRQTVIPVFYYVEPTDVRHQMGSYRNAFDKHESKHKSKVQLWRRALNNSADLSGIESSKFPNDAQVLKAIVDIVDLVLAKLPEPLVKSKGLVGLNAKIADVESLIRKRKEPKDISLIGLCGMGGIGKTTLAEEVFNKQRSEYEGSYFLADERDQSKKCGIIPLKENIFSKLLGYDVKINTVSSLPDDIVRRIGRMKALIVLDDVNDSDHVQQLLGTLDDFGSGSRIIVTSRDEQVLNANKADEIYRLLELSFDEALKLFNLIAFNQSDHQGEYDELSKRMVQYAQGVPLVLKVLAHCLCGKNKQVWESELNKLKKMPPKKVYEVMKLSYDDLDRKEQQIFLDLACFVLRLHKKVNLGNLKGLLKADGSDNSVVAELERLKDKALITFSEDNFVCMHDSLQEMGLEIVRQESNKDPTSRGWLWDPNDICEALKNDKGTGAIRSIQIDLTKIKEQKFRPEIFAKMSRLQFLEIYNGFDQDNILTEEGLRSLETELRYFCWYSYSLKSLPEKFCVEKLVILRLPFSRMEKLWDGVKNLVNLKELDLNSSQMLKDLPDLSKATNLEVLILWGCSKLTGLHPSIFSLAKLKKLDLWNCKSLTILASYSHLCSVRCLNSDDLNNIRELSLMLNMKEVRHSSCGRSLLVTESDLERLPLCFNNLSQLQYLELSYCKELQTISELPLSLKTLTVKQCNSLQSLPKLPLFLEMLGVQGCTLLQSLPELPMSLEMLDVPGCTLLQTLPKLPPSLKTLKTQYCKSLQILPELPLSLKKLDVQGCTLLQSLPKLPLSLEMLHVQGCTLLQSLPDLPFSHEMLDVLGCTSLQTLPKLPPPLKTLKTQYCKSLQILPELPLSLKKLDVQGCTLLQSLPELPLSLETLNVHECTSLQTLPKLSQSIKNLSVISCYSLQSLPELSLSTKMLHILGCTSLQTLSTLQTLLKLPLSLKKLDVHMSPLLQSLPELSLSTKMLHIPGCTSLQTLSTLQTLLKLPLSLKKLDVHMSPLLQSLPELPLSLEILNVHECTSLQTLPKLSQSLKILNVINCFSLQSLPELPLSLEILNVHECTSLLTLPKLSQSLKILNVINCFSLQSLPELPLSLKILNVHECTSLQSLPELPLSLEILNVHECTSLQTLPKLSQSIKNLSVISCYSLQSLPELSLSTKMLHIPGCTSLQTLSTLQTLLEIPLSLKKLDFHVCPLLQSLPELPLFLEILNVREHTSLQTLPKLSRSLKILNVINCFSLQSLPELPLSLEMLDVQGCTLLQTLPKLPPSLKTLKIQYCKSLQILPELPLSLKILNVHKCTSLQCLPELPLSLEIQNVHECTSLQCLPELPLSLEIQNVHECTSLLTLLKHRESLKILKS